MGRKEDLKKRLREDSRRSAEAADKELEGELEILRQANLLDLESLKPQISDPAAFDVLLAAVQEASAHNESLAQVKSRIKTLGKGVVQVAKEAAGLLNR